MTLGRAIATAAAALLVGALGACGSDDEPSAAPSSSGPTTEIATPSDPASYVPVPVGVSLTPAGTELGLGDAAVAAWTPRVDVVAVAGVTVTRIRRTTIEASFDTYRFEEAEAASTPYFVSAEVTNEGEGDLGGRRVPLYVVDDGGRLVAPTGIDPGYRPCPDGDLPAPFAPGDAARTCLIFLVPPGAEVAGVVFQPPEGVDPITWTGPVTPLRDRGPGKPQR